EVSGSGGIIKTGGGDLELTTSNSYSGLTIVAQGTVEADQSFALGATNSGTVVSNGASLFLDNDQRARNEPLQLSGPGSPSGGGALASGIGLAVCGAPILVGA